MGRANLPRRPGIARSEVKVVDPKNSILRKQLSVEPLADKMFQGFCILNTVSIKFTDTKYS